MARYLDDGMSQSQIAELLGCSSPAVVKAFKTLDIPARTPWSRHLQHGHALLEGNTPTYRTWIEMKARCFNRNKSQYPHYGGRGITVCERWKHSFENFLADMGERPVGMSIDRIDVDGNYEPSNCRWATQAEQIRNRRPRKAA